MPLDPALLATFALAIVVICIVPGPDQVFIVANGLRYGPRGGLAAAVGMSGGMLVHTTAAVLGLSALVRSSATAFETLRIGGAIYLLWLAVEALRSHGAQAEAAGSARPMHSSARIMRQAMTTNLLNPKIVVFFLAFLPQFVDRSRGEIAVQLLVLGLLFTIVGLVIDAAICLLAGRLGGRLAASRRVARALNRCAAAVYLGLATRLVTDR
jgi:threonine/homoserine/homoserine lactone efflux protein